MDWKRKISGCFGDQDQIFAGHYNDKKRAFELLTYFRIQRIGWSFVQPAFREHLERKGCGPKHITKQLTKIRNHMKPWMDD